jgi:tetratricopeptide (TPR) repeat protein
MGNREFIDKDHRIAMDFYDIQEEYNEENTAATIKKLNALIEKEPDFFDPYLLLYQILNYEEKQQEAEKFLNTAYERALKKIVDKDGNWPDIMEWGWIENRHIIRTFINKGVNLWENDQTNEALDLFRKLLKTNPNDNAGARYFILGIKMKMSYDDFNDEFDKGGYWDQDIDKWFDENVKNFPEEFGWWLKIFDE